jgi:hypothetical protein
MARKLRVLVLGDEGIALFLTNGTKIERKCSLPWAVPNLEQELVEVLQNKKNVNTPVFILYDALEQQYRKEDIVRTNILDQKKLVKRKLNSLFPNVLAYSFVHLKPPKKTKVKSKHNSYLIAALPSTEHMRRLEGILKESRVDIAGLAFLPVESSHFAGAFIDKLTKKSKKKKDKDAPTSRWTLMISHHETGGLRQIFTKDGTLALTRLTPLADNSPENPNWVDELYHEFTGTMGYISRFGFSTADGLDIVIICNENNKKELQSRDFKGANLHLYTVDEAAKIFGFSISSKRKNPNDQYADLLHAGWLARQRRLKMPFKIGWIEKIAVPRQVAKSASGVLALGMLALCYLAFTTWQQYTDFQQDIADREGNKRILEQEYEQEAKIFDVLPVRPKTVRTALELKDKIEDSTLYSYSILEKVNGVIKDRATLLSLTYDDQRTPDEEIVDKKPQARTGLAGLRNDNEKNFSIFVRFRLPDRMPIEEKIKTVDAVKLSFEQKFPGMKAEVTKQYGSAADQITDGALSGSFQESEKKKQQQQNIRPEENFAEIMLKGAHI